MSEEKVYPAIYKAVDGNAFVYLEVKNYYSIERECWDVSNGDDNHATDTNITPEHLKNTYGEVVSPEHAEFIIELAENAGFAFDGVNSELEDAKSFMIYEDSFDIYPFDAKELSNEDSRRKITIPLPPKQIQTATPEEDFEMAQIEKNNGDNLMFGGGDKCKEWPCVGDNAIVTLPDDYRLHYGHGVVGNNVVVMALFKDGDIDIAAVNFDGSNYCFRVDMLQKPLTPEEELFDAFWREVGLFMNQSNLNKGIFKAAFINSITKKPQ